MDWRDESVATDTAPTAPPTLDSLVPSPSFIIATIVYHFELWNSGNAFTQDIRANLLDGESTPTTYIETRHVGDGSKKLDTKSSNGDAPKKFKTSVLKKLDTKSRDGDALYLDTKSFDGDAPKPIIGKHVQLFNVPFYPCVAYGESCFNTNSNTNNVMANGTKLATKSIGATLQNHPVHGQLPRGSYRSPCQYLARCLGPYLLHFGSYSLPCHRFVDNIDTSCWKFPDTDCNCRPITRLTTNSQVPLPTQRSCTASVSPKHNLDTIFGSDIHVGDVQHNTSRGEHQWILACNDDRDGNFWNVKCISIHRNPASHHCCNWTGATHNAITASSIGETTFENGETAFGQFDWVVEDDFVSYATYICCSRLFGTPSWQYFKVMAKRQKKLVRTTNHAKLRFFKATHHDKYRSKKPQDYAQAVQLNERNSNNKWQDTTDLEMSQLHEHQVFNDKCHQDNMEPPDGYMKTQATVETSSFTSELAAACICAKWIVDTRLTLCYLGIPIRSNL